MTGRWQHVLVLVGASMLVPAFECSAGVTQLEFSLDTTSVGPVFVLNPRTVESRQWLQPPLQLGFGLPDSAVVAAFARRGSDVLVTPDITVTLGPAVVTPRDIALVTPSGTVSLFRRGSDLGLGDAAAIDALSASPDGTEVYFSINGTQSVAGLTARAADILRAGPTGTTIFRTGSSLGIPTSVNLVALEVSAGGGILGAFDLRFESAGVSIPAGALAEYLPATNRWVVARRVADVRYSCTGCGFSAVGAVIFSDLVFRSGAEQNEL